MRWRNQDLTSVKAYVHYREEMQAQRRRVALLQGLLVGLLAGLLWEAIRR